MRTWRLWTLAMLLIAAAGDAFAQTPTRPQVRQPLSAGAAPTLTRNIDVVVEVPELRVDSIGLRVDSLRAKLALDAQAANLVSIQAGADVRIDSVGLTIVGVEAEAYLYVDLDNVARIVNRVLTTIDRNPEIITGLLTTVDTVLGTVSTVGQSLLQPGGVVSQTVGTLGRTLDNITLPGGLLSQTVNTLGQTVVRTLDTTGRIVERTVDTTGRIVGENVVGNVSSLQVVSEARNAAGQLVRQVRDTTGALIEVTLDTAGRVINSRVVQAAAGQVR